MNLSVAAATLIFLLNPGSQWAGDRVLASKLSELVEMPSVHSADFDSWLRIREGQDVLRVSGFRMEHDLVSLNTDHIYVPLFDNWLRIETASANMPDKQMSWSFRQLEANFAGQQQGLLLSAKVSGLSYRGLAFDFGEQMQGELAGFYHFVADRFERGDLGDMRVELLDMKDYLQLTISWEQEGDFAMAFQVRSAVSYRDFSRRGYDSEVWSANVTEPVQVNLSTRDPVGVPEQFAIDWAVRPPVFEPLIELVLREVPNTINSMKGI